MGILLIKYFLLLTFPFLKKKSDNLESDLRRPLNLLSANLPGYTSFSKPESSFVQISMNQLTKRPFSLSFNLWASPDNQSPVFSTMISDKFFSRQLTLSAACITGNFLYDENNSSSWFLDSPYYHSDSHLCSLFQLSADYKNKNGRTGVYSGFMAGFYETPFGPYTAVYRTDLKVSIKQNEFYTSAFLNAYEDTLTSSGKQLEPGLQLKTGMLSKKPVLTSKAELVLIKFGFNAYSKINFQKNEHPMRLNTGIQFTTDKTSVSFSVSDSALLKSENPEDPPEEFENESVSFQIKNSWYFKRLVPALTLSAEIKEAVKYKIQINLTNNTKQKLSGNITYSFSEKDKEITSQKLSASLNCSFNFMNVRVIGKLAASVTM